jgi:hypothetical protein
LHFGNPERISIIQPGVAAPAATPGHRPDKFINSERVESFRRLIKPLQGFDFVRNHPA